MQHVATVLEENPGFGWARFDHDPMVYIDYVQQTVGGFCAIALSDDVIVESLYMRNAHTFADAVATAGKSNGWHPRFAPLARAAAVAIAK